MSAVVHEFHARVGGSFRISLTYEAPTGIGKSSPDTDTYHGQFVELVADRQVVEALEFETADPELRGQMMVTTTLVEVVGGTDVLVVHDGIPDGVPSGDHATGTRMALDNLAKLVEAGEATTPGPPAAAALPLDRRADVERLGRDLDDVDVALRRLDDGTYGTCEACGAALGAAVLQARPAARHCTDHEG